MRVDAGEVEEQSLAARAGVPGARGRTREERLARVFIALLGLGLAVRLFVVVERTASDLIFWDQWDFLSPLFEERGAWAMFTRQHGPHREGLGGLVVAALFRLSPWNGAVLARFAALALCLAAVLAVLCAWRLAARPRWFDAALPLLFIAPTASESYAGPSNPAHGPLPLLLALTAALLLCQRASIARALALGLLAASAVYTGFAILLVPPLALIQLVEGARATRRQERPLALASFAAVAFALASLVSFSIGYQLIPAAACYRFPAPQPWRYLPFAGLQLLRPFTSYGAHLGLPLELGASVLLCAAIALVAASLRELLGGARSALPGQGAPRAAPIFLLASFSLLFALDAAVGRVCLGMATAGSTRYVPYALPMATAAFLWFRTASLSPGLVRATGPALAALALVANLSQHASLAEARMFHEWKESWSACYLARHQLDGCNRDFKPVYPEPAVTGQQRKLDFLEARHLSLFREGR